MEQDLLDLNDSFFYGDFPSLPDLSSASSSSSIPAASKTIASSSSSSSASPSSSAASWAVLKSYAEEDADGKNYHRNSDQVDAPPTAALSSTASMEPLPPQDADCMDVMENFGYMDLIDSNEIWDPSSIFQTENTEEFHQTQPGCSQQSNPPGQSSHHLQHNFDQQNRPLDDLGVMFFEWLKSNKEHISAEDMRNIKLKRSTVECASKRLGNSTEGKKQLLKLILEWVEHCQLQKKRLGSEAAASTSAATASQFPPFQYQEPLQNPIPDPKFTCNPAVPPDVNNCFIPSQWIPPQPPHYVTEHHGVAPPSFTRMAAGYTADPYSRCVPEPVTPPQVHGYPLFMPCTEYRVLDTAQTWAPSQYTMAGQYCQYPESNNGTPTATAMPPSQSLVGHDTQCVHQYNQGNVGEKLVRLGASATKEARKKRMARQRRFLSHHHRHHQNCHNSQNPNVEQETRIGGENGNNPANWMYWPAAPTAATPSSSTAPATPADAPQQLTPAVAERPPVQAQSSQQQRQASSDKRAVD